MIKDVHMPDFFPSEKLNALLSSLRDVQYQDINPLEVEYFQTAISSYSPENSSEPRMDPDYPIARGGPPEFRPASRFWVLEGDPAQYYKDNSEGFPLPLELGNYDLKVPYSIAAPENEDQVAAVKLTFFANAAALAGPLGPGGLPSSLLAKYLNRGGQMYEISTTNMDTIASSLIYHAPGEELLSTPTQTVNYIEAAVREHQQETGLNEGFFTSYTPQHPVKTGDISQDFLYSFDSVQIQVGYEVNWTFDPDTRTFEISGRLKPYLYDFYDFEYQDVKIVVPEIVFNSLPKAFSDKFPDTAGDLNDSMFAYLQERGLARPFHVVGTGSVIPFKFKSDKAGNLEFSDLTPPRDTFPGR